MEFDWDKAKSQANLEKHGISFDEALQIFDGPVLTWIDDRQDYGELRYITIGALSPKAVLVVVHTERNGKTRLISARKANRKERKRYDGYLKEASQRD
jgi:uncharacterized DUF497 family protein